MRASGITDYLVALADPVRAAGAQRFFKTGPGEYGQGDVFLGIRVPVLRQTVKQFRAITLAETGKLLRSKYHEIRLFALLVMVGEYGRKTGMDKDEIYALYLKNTKYVNNWDLVDSSAYQIVGAHLLDRQRTKLFELAESASLWERRIAMVATYQFIRNGQFKDTLRIAELLLDDKEDLIHKSVGWMLREVGKRDLALEQKFICTHYARLQRTALRYAIEKFPLAERKRFLKGEFLS